ncbi:endoribonuclease l-psp [Leptolyngbya sp. Heron Island J]|uniref:RidA family protein n=1 Tax=Leptolyngbya sp. Heron Island J TaxID=1385935 RepID=UPI0003B9D35D|nr:RidA family protein [Leptolyngbya sp. Heron Island J]ESA32066.1 endoribonuclease l-psp [Leptolyngbya sp. Heron Island J]
MENTVSSGSPLEEIIGFSRARRIGEWIAVSGTAPLDHEGKTVHVNDVYLQAKRCLEISKEAIEALDGSIDNVIRTRIMLKDISLWQEAAKAHGEIFANIGPACTFVEVVGFINEAWLVETEVDCIVKP